MSKRKIAKFIVLFNPYLKNFLKNQLLEQDYISYNEIEKILKKLNRCFEEPLTITKIKSYLILFDTINYETQIKNYLLYRTVTILKKEIIRKYEKEKFVNYIARALLYDWQKIENKTKLIIINTINEAIDNLGIKDEEFIDNLITLINIIVPYSFYKFKKDEFNQLVRLIIEVIRNIEKNTDTEEKLDKLINFLLIKFNIIEYMNKSFRSVKLANLLLNPITKGLHIKKITSLTQFIIFISCKIIYTEILNKINKKELTKLKLNLTKLL